MSLTTVDVPTRTIGWAGRGAGRPVAMFAASRHALVARFAVGMVAALGALALPWIGLNLSSSLSVWDLDFSLGAVPLLHHLSYGVAVGALAVAAVVSFVRAGGQATRVTRSVGWAYLALALVFVVTTRIAGGATMFTLQNDVNQSAIINGQFLTNNNTPPPTQFLGINFDAKSLVLLYGLRFGWYLLVVSGLFLVGRVGRPTNRPQWVAAALSGLAAVVVLVGLLLATLAQGDVDNGIQAVATGRPDAGQSLIASALRLNPQTAYDSGLERALGQAQAQQNRTTGLAAYAEAERPAGRDLTLLEQAQLFQKAATTIPSGTPAAAVVRADLISFLANATITAKNPNVLSLVKGQFDSAAVSFSEGRFYYQAGATTLAISTLQRAMAETSNSEVRSLALTYIALAWQRQGNEAAFRSNITAAVKADTLNENVYAREISTGLYVPGSP